MPHLLFAINNQCKDTLSGLSPVQVELGITPITPIDLLSEVARQQAAGRHPAQVKSSDAKSAAQERIEALTEVREQVLQHIETVKAHMKKYADERRRTVDVLIKVNSKAYVKMPRAQLERHGLRPSNKLSATCFGPFKVIEQVSPNAFRLDLGDAVSSRTISVFHVKYLRPAPDGPYGSPGMLQPLPVFEEDGQDHWEVAGILDRKRHYGKTKYLVQYKGYPLLDDCEWRPEQELKDFAPQILAEFNERFNKKPTPRRRKPV